MPATPSPRRVIVAAVAAESDPLLLHVNLTLEQLERLGGILASFERLRHLARDAIAPADASAGFDAVVATLRRRFGHLLIDAVIEADASDAALANGPPPNLLLPVWLAEFAAADPGLLLVTPHCRVNLDDPSQVDRAAVWWEELTRAGGAGMVVKPITFVARSKKGIVQPALKCRGPEYLRTLYGPDYTLRSISTVCGSAAAAPSAGSPSASSRLVLKRWRDSSSVRRCAASMSASSPSSRWRASRSIPGFNQGKCASLSGARSKPPSEHSARRLRNAPAIAYQHERPPAEPVF